VTNGTGVYKNSVYDSSGFDKNLSDVARKSSCRNRTQYSSLHWSKNKNVLLNMYVKQEVYIPMFLQRATGNTCRDHWAIQQCSLNTSLWLVRTIKVNTRNKYRLHR